MVTQAVIDGSTPWKHDSMNANAAGSVTHNNESIVELRYRHT